MPEPALNARRLLHSLKPWPRSPRRREGEEEEEEEEEEDDENDDEDDLPLALPLSPTEQRRNFIP
jgi:hypothetical protein